MNKRWLFLPAFISLTAYFYILPLTYVDFTNIFYPVGQRWLSPYQDRNNFFNPPWLAMIIAPFTLLPPRLAVSAWLAMGCLVIGMLLKHPEKIGWCVTSPGFLVMITIGQVDWLVLLGVMFPQVSLVLFVIKPQAVILLSLSYINRQSIVVFFAVLTISFLVWGWWPLQLPYRSPNQAMNISVFPLLAPVGIYLTWRGYQQSNDVYLCIASLCIAPYFMPQSLLPAYVLYLDQTDNRQQWLLGWSVNWAYYLAMKLLF